VTPYYSDELVTLYHGDCREVLKAIDLETIDLIVTDPPYAVSVAGVGRWETRYGRTDDLDFFDGDTDWSAMTATVLEAFSLSLPKLRGHGSFYGNNILDKSSPLP
jgi:DNA modification methylase